jgi:hypothetical protein
MDGGEVADGEPEAGGGAAHFLTRVRLGCDGDGSGAAQEKEKYTFLWAPLKLAQIITPLAG